MHEKQETMVQPWVECQLEIMPDGHVILHVSVIEGLTFGEAAQGRAEAEDRMNHFVWGVPAFKTMKTRYPRAHVRGVIKEYYSQWLESDAQRAAFVEAVFYMKTWPQGNTWPQGETWQRGQIWGKTVLDRATTFACNLHSDSLVIASRLGCKCHNCSGTGISVGWWRREVSKRVSGGVALCSFSELHE